MLYPKWVSALRYVDLVNGSHPSFSKIVCAIILIASVAQRNLTLGVVIALLAASFGRSAFLSAINKGNLKLQGDSHEDI